MNPGLCHLQGMTEVWEVLTAGLGALAYPQACKGQGVLREDNPAFASSSSFSLNPRVSSLAIPNLVCESVKGLQFSPVLPSPSSPAQSTP